MAVWTPNLVTSVAFWTSSVYYSSALQWLFELQAWSYQSMPEIYQVNFTALHFNVYLDYEAYHFIHFLNYIKCTLQCWSSVAVWAISLVTSVTAITP
ncbi:hypothetical protein TNCV_3951771 [Trichonephila clavipes]|nr:hypothetical protein TNCV_3951771 [Trichonephila clavipes]